MDLRIGGTFTGSLAGITGDEQKLAETTAFDLQLKPASPGMQFHRLDKSRDANFCSVRTNLHLRLIAHRAAPGRLAVKMDEAEERDRVADAIRSWTADGYRPHEIAIFVRSQDELSRAQHAAESAGVPFVVLNERMETRANHLTIGTMHLAKGMEFRAVIVMACDDEVIPSQTRIESVSDESDLEEVYQTERHLLYVACTRARDQLLVTGVKPGSEFLEDLALSTRLR